MLRLVLATLWRRRAQTALLVLLATVAAAGAAAAPGYIAASLQSLASASVGDAPVADRLVTARGDRDVSDRLPADLTGFADKVRAALSLDGFDSVTGAAMVAVVGRQANELQTLAYRDDVCAHLSIDGACPRGANEVLLPQALADRLGVGVGDALPLRGRTEIPPIPVTVAGRYRTIDPFDAYWGAEAGNGPGERLSETAVFTPLATFASLRPNRVEVGVDLIATPRAYRDTDVTTVAARAEHGALVLGTEAIRVSSGLQRLTERLGDEQRLVVNGVIIGVGELLVVCWLALFLAVRRTAETRRPDIGLLKLRGIRRRDLWRLVAGQSLVPLVAGGLIGLVAGPALATWLAGTGGTAPGDPTGLNGMGLGTGLSQTGLTVVAVVVAVLGAAAVALAAERSTLGESVATLGRRVGRPRLGRLAIVDAVVVLLALAGAYQATVQGAPDPGGQAGAGGVALLAPLLLALAVGVLVTRLVPLAANRTGSRAVRAGRLGSGLSALHLARRTGTASTLAVLTVVVGVLTATGLSWSVAAAAREQRAVAEVGAARVLTVRAPGAYPLLAAVRSADPPGTGAMAVVRTQASAGTVLAVDATRLAAIVPALAAYGLPDWTRLAAALHPDGYDPVTVRTGSLTLDATWSGTAAPGTAAPGTAAPGTGTAASGTAAAAVALEVRLVGPDGAPVEVSTGALDAGRHRYAVPTPACTGGCRLASVSLTSTVDGLPAGSTLTLHALDGVGGPGLLADRTRWRAGVAAAGPVPDIAVVADGLRLGIGPGVPASPTGQAATAYVADAPSPLPVAQAGAISLDRGDPRSIVVGDDAVPVRVSASGLALPSLGPGLLADLEYADRLAGAGGVHDAGGAILQVWLAPDLDPAASAGILDRLSAAGVTIVADDSIADRQAALDARGPATALRFLLVAALVLAAMGLLSFAVAATAERRARAVELAALRRQGLRARVVRRVGLVGYPMLGLLAVGLGLVTGVGINALVPAPLPVFATEPGGAVDPFAGLPGPGLPVGPLLAAAVAVLIATAVTLAAGLGLVATVRRQLALDRTGSSWSG